MNHFCFDYGPLFFLYFEILCITIKNILCAKPFINTSFFVCHVLSFIFYFQQRYILEASMSYGQSCLSKWCFNFEIVCFPFFTRLPNASSGNSSKLKEDFCVVQLHQRIVVIHLGKRTKYNLL